jgi:hypothetical protein
LPSGEIQFPKVGSRDAFCTFIGQEVARVIFKEERFLEFSFASGNRLVIPLDADSYIGPEALHWHPDYDHMSIW